jgi:uncharacterized protein (TIGR02757 family)
MSLREHADALEELYRRRNRREHRRDDPVRFLHDYPRPRDRELVALVASALAYGRVGQIMRSVSAVLEALGPRPAERLAEEPPPRLRRRLAGFTHRFCRGSHLAALLVGARRLAAQYGSLEACFASGLREEAQTVVEALGAFASRLRAASGGGCGHLLADPARGSACKRLHLMLRWLVRRDVIDPGGWEGVGAWRLVVPLDVHVHRAAVRLGATRRRSADLRAALEVTAAFRGIRPDDPVRYDFALAHLGMSGGLGAPGSAGSFRIKEGSVSKCREP